MKLNLLVALASVLLGICWWVLRSEAQPQISQASCIGDKNHLPHCAPKDGSIEPWKKHPLVSASEKEVIKKFGNPDGVWKQPYHLVAGSDQTWVYHGTGTGWNRTGQHIFVFTNGKCVAASDSFIYTN